MRIIVDYLAERQNYKPTTQKLVHPEALLLMLKALTNDDRYIEMMSTLTEEEKKGEITMCELLDKYENRGIQKGIQKGIQQGEIRFASLIEELLQSNRMEDLRKVVNDERYRSRLYEELDIL